MSSPRRQSTTAVSVSTWTPRQPSILSVYSKDRRTSSSPAMPPGKLTSLMMKQKKTMQALQKIALQREIKTMKERKKRRICLLNRDSDHLFELETPRNKVNIEASRRLSASEINLLKSDSNASQPLSKMTRAERNMLLTTRRARATKSIHGFRYHANGDEKIDDDEEKIIVNHLHDAQSLRDLQSQVVSLVYDYPAPHHRDGATGNPALSPRRLDTQPIGILRQDASDSNRSNVASASSGNELRASTSPENGKRTPTSSGNEKKNSTSSGNEKRTSTPSGNDQHHRHHALNDKQHYGRRITITANKNTSETLSKNRSDNHNMSEDMVLPISRVQFIEGDIKSTRDIPKNHSRRESWHSQHSRHDVQYGQATDKWDNILRKMSAKLDTTSVRPSVAHTDRDTPMSSGFMMGRKSIAAENYVKRSSLTLPSERMSSNGSRKSSLQHAPLFFERASAVGTPHGSLYSFDPYGPRRESAYGSRKASLENDFLNPSSERTSPYGKRRESAYGSRKSSLQQSWSKASPGRNSLDTSRRASTYGSRGSSFQQSTVQLPVSSEKTSTRASRNESFQHSGLNSRRRSSNETKAPSYEDRWSRRHSSMDLEFELLNLGLSLETIASSKCNAFVDPRVSVSRPRSRKESLLEQKIQQEEENIEEIAKNKSLYLQSLQKTKQRSRLIKEGIVPN